MVKTAPHWGQHEVIEAYYADRASPDEMLVAYQMNWKGENFYTGNHIPAFVSTGVDVHDVAEEEARRGREGDVLRHRARPHRRPQERGRRRRAYSEVTDKTLCNKFVLVRAEL